MQDADRGHQSSSFSSHRNWPAALAGGDALAEPNRGPKDAGARAEAVEPIPRSLAGKAAGASPPRGGLRTLGPKLSAD